MHFMETPTNFYLGAKVDPNTHQVIDDDVVYYDSRDLTTHGVILGMTGSGKTGLGITILEEAVIDGIRVVGQVKDREEAFAAYDDALDDERRSLARRRRRLVDGLLDGTVAAIGEDAVERAVAATVWDPDYPSLMPA